MTDEQLAAALECETCMAALDEMVELADDPDTPVVRQTHWFEVLASWHDTGHPELGDEPEE